MNYQQVLDLIGTRLASGTQITAEEHREVEKAILDFTESQWLTGDLKMIDCTQQYITDNFEPNGLGKNERFGWAICNGANGTMNRTGRVPVAWGLSAVDTSGENIAQPIIKNSFSGNEIIAGNKNHILTIPEMPKHSHDIMFRRDATGNGSGNFLTLANTDGTDEGGVTTYSGGDTMASDVRIKTTGGIAAHNNMQPYIVTLFIQKL